MCSGKPLVPIAKYYSHRLLLNSLHDNLGIVLHESNFHKIGHRNLTVCNAKVE